jgi:uncharacterized delta-60 repeat protein
MQHHLGLLPAFALPLFALVAASAGGCTGDDPQQTSVCTGAECAAPDAGTVPAFSIATAPTFTLTQGGAIQIDITVKREGFDGPINAAATAESLPTGVASTPLLIPAGANAGKLTLSALASTVQGTKQFTITASNADGTVRSETRVSLLVRGGPGVLDTTFGTGGKVVTKVGTAGIIVSGVAVQTDGSVLASGQSDNDFAVARLDANGALDTTYGKGGKATADLRAPDNVASLDFPGGIALASNGNAVVAGYRQNTNTTHGIARFTTAGALDTKFDLDGYAMPLIPPGDWNNNIANAVTVQPDSKPIFAGTSMLNGGGKLHAVVARFKDNGALDDTFGTNDTGWFYGQSVAGPAGTDDTCQAVALAPGNKIVAAGISVEGGAGNNIFALRLDALGKVDPQFGTRQGFSTISFATTPQAKSVHALADGRVLITIQDGSKLIVVRLSATGVPDDKFGPGGKVTVELGRAIDGAASILDASEHLVIVASALNEQGELVLARLLDDGKLDPAFATNGTFVAKTGLKTGKQNVRIAQQSDGRIVIVTNVEDVAPAARDLVVYRFWGDDAHLNLL